MGGWSIALLAGGNWNNSSYCGSRSRNGNNGRGTVNANNGRRGACDIGKVFVVRNSQAGSVHLVNIPEKVMAKHTTEKRLLLVAKAKARAF